MNKSKLSYWEKLKDPRWQKKRLEVLERADFKCQECGDGESTLHVHHPFYEKGREPWEYDEIFELMCLCENCHTVAHIEEYQFAELSNKLKSDPNFRPNGLRFITGFLTAYLHDGPFDIVLEDESFADGVACYFRQHESNLLNEFPEGSIPWLKLIEWQKSLSTFSKSSSDNPV